MESHQIHKPLRSIKLSFCNTASYLTPLYNSEGLSFKELIVKNQGSYSTCLMPSIVKWHTLINRHLLMAYLPTQSLLPSAKI